MAAIDDIDITSLLFQEGSAPTTPASTKWRAYFKTDGLYVIDDAGTETGPLGSASAPTVELDYVQITSNASITATTEATANTVVTGASVAYDGSTAVYIEFQASRARPNATASSVMEYWLYEDGSSIGRIGYQQADSTSPYKPIHLGRRMTPGSGSHTYSIRASVNSGTGVIVAGAGGAATDMPAYMSIRKALP